MTIFLQNGSRKGEWEIKWIAHGEALRNTEDKAMAMIHEICKLLYARQEIICSKTVPYFAQRTREEELTSMASSLAMSLARQLNIKADLIKLFQDTVPACSRATITIG